MNVQDTLMNPQEKGRRYAEEVDKLTRGGQSVRSYRVMVLTPGDQDWCGNGMRYAGVEDARKAAESLFMRWTAVKDTAIFPSADEPNA